MTVAGPHYFGSSDRSHFSFLHWPQGTIRGASVVCPPLGYEDVCAHTSLRRLAEELAAAGIATLRIDYDGTGNSIGSARDPARVAAWTQTIVEAAAQFGDWGLPSVTLIGLRFGATLAVAAAAKISAVSSLVLWDPVVSGRRYVRSMRIFSAAGGNTPLPDAGISVAGVEFDGATLAEMTTVRITAEQLAVPCLIVARAEAESEAQGLADEASSNTVDLRTIDGTSDLLDVDAELAIVPDEILREITTWTRNRTVDQLDPQPACPSCRSTATEIRDGVALRHRALRVGPTGLFVIDTARADEPPTGAVITLNNGVARSIGPGGAWVEFAAMLAGDRLRVLRLDLSGLGDSPPRRGRVENDTYAATVAEDLGDLIDHLRPEGSGPIAVLGLCSGALVGFDAVLAHPEIRFVVSVNGRFDKPFHDRRADRAVRAAGQTTRSLCLPLSKTPLLGFFEKVPTWFWRWLDRTHLVASPTVALEKALARDIRILLIFGDDEWGLGALRRRGGKRFNKLLANPLTTLVEVPGLDHSMFDVRGRDAVRALVHQYLRGVALDAKSSACTD